MRHPGLDIAASTANATTAPIVVDAANNHCGGGPPALPASWNHIAGRLDHIDARRHVA